MTGSDEGFIQESNQAGYQFFEHVPRRREGLHLRSSLIMNVCINLYFFDAFQSLSNISSNAVPQFAFISPVAPLQPVAASAQSPHSSVPSLAHGGSQ